MYRLIIVYFWVFWFGIFIADEGFLGFGSFERFFDGYYFEFWKCLCLIIIILIIVINMYWVFNYMLDIVFSVLYIISYL